MYVYVYVCMDVYMCMDAHTHVCIYHVGCMCKYSRRVCACTGLVMYASGLDMGVLVAVAVACTPTAFLRTACPVVACFFGLGSCRFSLRLRLRFFFCV